MQQLLTSIREKIRRYYRHKLWAAALLGAARFTVLSSATFLLIVLGELIFNSGSKTRTVLFFSWIALNLVSLSILVILPVVKSLKSLSWKEVIELAKEIGGFHPELKDKLANALQLQLATGTNETANTFSELAFRQTTSLTDALDFTRDISYQRSKKNLTYAVGSALLSLLLVVVVPTIRLAAGRVLMFTHDFAPPARFIVNILPGNLKLTKGTDLLGKVIVFGGKAKTVSLFSKQKEESSFQKRELVPDSIGEYTFQVKSLHSDLEYYAAAEEVLSNKYLVNVIDCPVIKELRIRVQPPAYSRLPNLEQVDNGSFSCLYGSRVSVNLISSGELLEAKLVFNDTVSSPMTVHGENAASEITPKMDASYKIMIKDREGNYNESPVNYSIKLFYDAPPSIELLEPRGNSLLQSDQRNALVVKIADDYGFSDLKLHYRLSKSEFEKPDEQYTAVSIPIDHSKNEQLVNYIWNLSPLSLVAGDVISYYIEVADNDMVSGPKKARTAELTIRQPSIDEIAKQADQDQNKSTQDLAKTFKEAEDLKKEFEAISKEMLKDKKDLSWEEKERIQSAARKFEKLKDKVSDIQQQLQETVKDLQKNNMLSKETMEKYLELQKMMNEMNSADLQKALEKMQQNLEKLDRKQAQMDMQNMKMNEEMFQKSIERTMNLLKRIQIEQKLDELSKRADAIQKQQDALSEKTEKSKSGDSKTQSDLKKQQDALSKQLEQFQKDMKDLANKMNEFKDLPNEQAKELQKELQDQKNEELSESAEKDIQQEMNQSAAQKQKQISKQMQKMSKGLKSLQSSLMQQQQQKVFAGMMKMINEMLETSKMQEQLKAKTSQGERDMSFNENARKQEELERDIDNLTKEMASLAQKTFAITPEMGKELGDAKRQMDQAMKSLQNRNSAAAGDNQAEAMKSINGAAKLMKEGAENMMQGGGQGGGMMSLMQQLGKLSGQQMSLNNIMQQMMKGQNGQMSPEQMQTMQRLAQQQEMIRKSLEDLNKEARSQGNSKRLSGNLEQIAKQMEEIVSDMKTQKLNDNMIQKQERILSRMLDAQLSVNERDFEKDRESNTGKNVAGKSPQELRKGTTPNDRLKDELINSMRDVYVKDYETLIKKYLEKLGSSGE